MATGWLVGGPGGDTRTATAMATAVRNVGVSLVIATASFPGTLAVSAATVFAIFQTVGVALLAACWGRLRRSPESFDATQDDSDESLLRGSVRT